MAPAANPNTPEGRAREKIDALLEQSGWTVQDRADMNLSVPAVAVREFKLERGHGYADYLLFVDGIAVGVCEAKKSGVLVRNVEIQTQKYVDGLPKDLEAPYQPLPFAYISTGEETAFINLFDPHPRTREIFTFHRPETIRTWLTDDTLSAWVTANGSHTAADDTKPSTLRSRLRAMPPVELPGMWDNKVEAVTNIEKSLFDDRPRALVQMATGSGKTLLAVATIYRLIKFGGARRVLFLVDRANLGEQAAEAFETFRTPDDQRKFIELYTVQRLTSNTIGSSSKVVICTIQRLYSILKGEPELDPEAEAHSNLDSDDVTPKEPLPVIYDKSIPPEFFDVVFVDECHRSIYSIWRQVLEYFDAHLIGLTATPAKHTYGFFNQNLVMEYPHERAVVEGANVTFDVYRIRTQITAEGSTVTAGPGVMLGYRDRLTRKTRWEAPDDSVTYKASDLDRNVVALDQIRLVLRTFRDRVLPEAFPDRTAVPKTLIFAKDDSHAEDIVRIAREEFGQGNDFASKITYKVTGAKPKDLIKGFQNSYAPRIAVTVDLIATGTDIKAVEIVMFMRTVKSRVLFEQMKGRGVRVINTDELRAVTPDAKAKTRFLVVDCVGVCEAKLADSKPLERSPTVPLKNLLEHVASGGTNDDYLASLAGRIARIDRQCGPDEHKRVIAVTGGLTLAQLAGALVNAVDDEVQDTAARDKYNLAPHEEPTDAQLKEASKPLKRAAAAPLLATPALRKLLIELRQQFEQIVDAVSIDVLNQDLTGYSAEAKERAAALVTSFEAYLAKHKHEIEALQFFYSVRHKKRLRYADIKALADAIASPPQSWTPEILWHAYETLEKSKVRGASAGRLLTDIVSLVRFALHKDGELVPYADRVHQRYANWLAQQANRGRTFTGEQIEWLDMMRDHIATSLEVDVDDFDLTPFAAEGGLARAAKVFGAELSSVVLELNEVLAA